MRSPILSPTRGRISDAGMERRWQAVGESLPFIQDFHALQADWDRQAAFVPMAEPRPSLARLVQTFGVLLIAFIVAIFAVVIL